MRCPVRGRTPPARGSELTEIAGVHFACGWTAACAGAHPVHVGFGTVFFLKAILLVSPLDLRMSCVCPHNSLSDCQSHNFNYTQDLQHRSRFNACLCVGRWHPNPNRGACSLDGDESLQQWTDRQVALTLWMLCAHCFAVHEGCTVLGTLSC
jgi:hypothetical protein